MGFVQIALIRGINVGKSKRVAMSDLRALIEELGYQEVCTVLNSENVIFTGADITASANHIEEALFIRTGVPAKVTVVTAEELDAIIENNPFSQIVTDPSRFIIAFFSHPENRQQILSLEKHSWTPEALAVGARVAYLWCPDGVLASRMSASVNKILGDNVTSRNWTTLMKIHAIASKHSRER